jgi:hypothetical protein
MQFKKLSTTETLSFLHVLLSSVVEISRQWEILRVLADPA